MTTTQHPDITDTDHAAGTLECDARTLVSQINRMTLMAISGGRVLDTGHGVILPVGNGFKVVVDLMAGDTYRVRRLFFRGFKVFLHGERTNVYCDDLSEVAYFASCFRSYDATVWPTKA